MPKLNFLPDRLELDGIVTYDGESNDFDFFNPSREGIVSKKPVAPDPTNKGQPVQSSQP